MLGFSTLTTTNLHWVVDVPCTNWRQVYIATRLSFCSWIFVLWAKQTGLHYNTRSGHSVRVGFLKTEQDRERWVGSEKERDDRHNYKTERDICNLFILYKGDGRISFLITQKYEKLVCVSDVQILPHINHHHRCTLSDRQVYPVMEIPLLVSYYNQ